MRMVFPTNMTGRFLDDLATEMNTFVESILGDETTQSSMGFAPRMDVEETDDRYFLSFDLPGVDFADVQIDVEDDQLLVHGKRVGRTDESVKRHRSERAFGEFRRVVKMPEMVDIDAVSADFDNGVLTVTLPKLPEKKTSRRIVISKGDKTVKDGVTDTHSEE